MHMCVCTCAYLCWCKCPCVCMAVHVHVCAPVLMVLHVSVCVHPGTPVGGLCSSWLVSPGSPCLCPWSSLWTWGIEF